MLNLSKSLDFKEYLKKSQETYGDIQNEAYENTSLSEYCKNSMKSLDEEVNMVVFTEGFCPDCIVTVPFIQRFSEENENLKVHYLPRTGYEDFLEEAVGRKSIPTVITFDKDMNPKGAYVEIPKELTEKMIKLSKDEREALINEYRAGKFNDLIEKDLLEIIL
ncbi:MULTISPECIES: thioredoxin family protein [Clostridium]|uniref:Thioredoxin family protein n=1 Tax=Clostridium senegalense TaxID=1465809 RepID=A0A6M0H385_9CLOT|nr:MULTISPECIES: thioredoxin family protein [Clostridium]NEU04688.1 thioredoxin family protein [Clostridium senegalense]